MASIARTYDCSPPAISYIVSRSRARNAPTEAEPEASTAPPPQEPQLVKSHPVETAPPPAIAIDSLSAPPREPATFVPTPAEPRDERENAFREPSREPSELRLFPDEGSASIIRRAPPREASDVTAEPQNHRPRDPSPSGNGNAVRPPLPAGTPPYGEPRRTLHLSLPGSEGDPRHDAPPHATPSPHVPAGERLAAPPLGAHAAAGQASRHGMGQYPPGSNGAPLRPVPEMPRAKEGGAFIDRTLRERVDGDIAAFLAAFDAALDEDTAESRTGLREATDRLLRAGARTRIELERLEARVPLTPRDKNGQEARAFRPR